MIATNSFIALRNNAINGVILAAFFITVITFSSKLHVVSERSKRQLDAQL